MTSVTQHDQNIACKGLSVSRNFTMYFSHPVSKQSNCRQVLMFLQTGVIVHTVCFPAAKINHDRGSGVFPW